MERLRLLKAWSHGGEDFAVGEEFTADNADAIVEELIKNGTAELATATISRVATETKGTGTDGGEKAATLSDVKTIVQEVLGSVAGETKRPHLTVGKNRQEDDPGKGFKSPRDFICDVLKVRPGQRVPERLKMLHVRDDGDGVATKTVQSDEMSTFADPYGGYLVPITFTPELLRIEPEDDFTAGKTRMIPMKTPHVEFPARVDKDHSTSVSGGLTVTRRAEVQQMTASRMTLEKVTLRAHTLFGFDAVTEEVLTDSAISFAALLADGFRDEFTSHMIGEKLNGTGVGEYMGVLKSPALVSITAEAGQVADTLVYENLVKMRARCWGYQNAMWIGNHDILPELMFINQTAGTMGLPNAWQPSAREDHPDMIFGKPLILTEYAQTLGDKGDIMLCNFREYLEGILQPLQSAESVHLRFDYHERVFKFWLRNAGEPWWRSAMTPQNSTNTLSPFVTLNERA